MSQQISNKIAKFGQLNPTAERYLGALFTTKGMFSVTLIVVLGGLALAAPLLFPEGYDVQTRDSLLPPSFAHPFGTDELGRDIFVRAVFGLRVDLSLIFTAVVACMAIGTVLGLLGAVSQFLGTFIQRVLDIIAGFPGLILGICIVIVVGPGWTALAIAITIAGLPGFGRLSRAVLLAQLQREYVIAAQTLGVSRWTIMMRHILPNAVEPVLVQASIFVVAAIFIEAGLSIVGLGLQPPEPSIGILLNQGMRYITRAPFYLVGPMVVLMLLALSFAMLADALNQVGRRNR
ncbi:ABC transporter permease [Pelagibacterium halotolerans]|uniref:Dipeptide transport system permease protein DppC n=1 Tax=Pelagibacterium halotolerans (strain DSM 22347 / JCM 15775 / CGMCC 1.7692 / B2) TaxID=1082931 RepID=G4R7F4_PELHB|nr:ABC transporter permease [Pelagibacterium halotolerans]AEQ51279.1 dipeptide transport system permease protein DppC [Pelagibacterium halotolerans B2]QJR18865.1 ABC transporter permease [Pelagibacterium halotolerans]SEA66597.1 peptide/nickel transport system permease protein [Pelagibacterium halotolerans]